MALGGEAILLKPTDGRLAILRRRLTEKPLVAQTNRPTTLVGATDPNRLGRELEHVAAIQLASREESAVVGIVLQLADDLLNHDRLGLHDSERAPEAVPNSAHGPIFGPV